MKTGKTQLKLYYTERVEIEPGIWEDKLKFQTVKATEQTIYARRRDLAMRDGIVLTARFTVRAHLVTDDFKYAEFNGYNFKLHNVERSITAHETIIELGERA